ncbi:MAG: hypothetical protein JEY99_13520 [Spirochaetales bacterium]|nr:hypothetical protein [Spirochaetales bacterium]
MNKFFFIFIIAFSIILLLSAVIGGFVIFDKNRTDLIDMTESASFSMAAGLNRNFAKGVYPGSPEFGELSEAFFDRHPGLHSIVIYTPDAGIFYAKTDIPGVFDTQELASLVWDGKIPYSDAVMNELIQSRDLQPFDQLTNLKMEVVFENSFTPSNYKLSLTFFFIITGLLVFTIFALIFSDSDTKAVAEVTTVEKKPSPAMPMEVHKEAPSRSTSSESPPSDNTVVAQTETVEKIEAKNSTSNEEKQSVESCIYSTKTGFVKSELLIDKLDQELKRSASFDQDLVLVICSIKGMKDSDIGKFQKIVSESFPYKDLVFDYGTSSFAIIIPNIDLESSSTNIENFQIKIEKAGVSGTLSAGISSRIGRLLTGDRLLLEASSSHKRAASEKNGGIILFRISPKKYRQVISQKAH